MSCGYNNSCGKLCPRFVVTAAVTFADGTLTLNLPDTMSYENREKYCLVIGQTIPEAATVFAPVVVTVGTGTTEFPLLTCNGAQVVVSQLSTRTIYPVRVATNAAGGTLRVLRRLRKVDTSSLTALNDAVEGGAGA